MTDETTPDPGRALDLEDEEVEPKSTLSQLIFDAIAMADCYCKPGDPTCEDWRDSQHRWEAIHHSVMTTLDLNDIPKPSNLVRHARRELELIGEEPETIDDYVTVIQAFADSSLSDSGGSAYASIPIISKLLLFQNLRPLTNDPAEWFHHGEDIWGESGGIWQNIRNGEAFSNDGGNTYYLLSEGGNDKNRAPLHISDKFSPGNKKEE